VRLAFIPFAGGAPARYVDLPGDVAPQRGGMRWHPDGRSICFVLDRPPVPNLWCQPVDGGAPRQLTHFQTEFLHTFALSADGSQVAVSRGVETSDLVLMRNFR
jgi:Tol biopolymer transport system component